MAFRSYNMGEEPVLVARCSQGDRLAFDVLWERYHGRIYHFIHVRVGNLDEAEDLTQETFIRAWSALSGGTQVDAFPPWLYQIARNVVNDWADRRRRTGVPEALEDHREPPVSGPSVEQVVEARLSWEFLVKQLDEVLLYNAGTPEGKKSGLLRKLAFLSFYVDGLTLPQLQAELTPHAQALGLPAPTPTQLNNWLSRGDILSSLVRHLVQDHPDWIVATVKECLDGLSLPEKDAEIARWRWQEGLSLQAIAERSGLPVGDVSQTTERIARGLVPRVSARLKAQLHEVRKQS
jgi:RNA polymerase sigma factor (sigma-70 family)